MEGLSADRENWTAHKESGSENANEISLTYEEVDTRILTNSKCQRTKCAIAQE
jgi:hypothetical protein